MEVVCYYWILDKNWLYVPLQRLLNVVEELEVKEDQEDREEETPYGEELESTKVSHE